MAITFFESDKPQSNDLPWLSDYVETADNYQETAFIVRKVALTPKGLLLETDYFKAFVFKSSVQHTHLLEALEVWTEDLAPQFVLVLVIGDNPRNFKLGVDDAELNEGWKKTGKVYFQNFPQEKEGSDKSTQSNPLLLKSPPNSAKSVRSTKSARKTKGEIMEEF